ncbi:hypothetical protein JW848_02480 [Candidatus Bipolaricaulota bacterium]|nr:hypothetical protein [Candidatus Bipolaricaulota bacterium]
MTDERFAEDLRREIKDRIHEELGKIKDVRIEMDDREERPGGRGRKSEELRDVLETVSTMLPNLLGGLRDVLYSKSAAENMGDAVGTFYKKLVDSGMSKEVALEMAQGYMLNLREVFTSKSFDMGNIHVNRERNSEKEED